MLNPYTLRNPLFRFIIQTAHFSVTHLNIHREQTRLDDPGQTGNFTLNPVHPSNPGSGSCSPVSYLNQHNKGTGTPLGKQCKVSLN